MNSENTAIFEPSADYMSVETGIEPCDQRKLLNGLSRALADTYALALKTQNFHWNVVGPLFHSLHTMSEEQYRDMAEAVDTLAERIRAIGFPAPGSFQEFAALSSLSEFTTPKPAHVMMSILADDHDTVARLLREVIDASSACSDHATADLLTQRITFHEKASWMLRSTLAIDPSAPQDHAVDP